MRFTEREIDLMRKIGLDLDFEHPEAFSDDEWVQIEEVVGERLELHELDKNYEPTPDGMICEDILGKLP